MRFFFVDTFSSPQPTQRFSRYHHPYQIIRSIMPEDIDHAYDYLY